MEPTGSTAGSYREGAARAFASIEIDLKAGVSPALAGLFVASGLGLAGLVIGVAWALSMSIFDRYVQAAAIVFAALVLAIPAELARRRRVVFGPDALVVHPSPIALGAAPLRLPTKRVQSLALVDVGSRVNLVAHTDDGVSTLLEGMLPASRVIDLPRVYAAYRAALDADA